MLKTYLKIAWRNLKAYHLFSVINVLGLSLGVAIALLLFVFVRHELSFDQFSKQGVSFYRVLLHTEDELFAEETWANAPPVVAPTLKNEVSGVTHAARILQNSFGENAYITALDKTHVESGLFWCDADIFNILPFKIRRGNVTTLKRPNTVALSEETASRYFGVADPLGKIVKVDNLRDLEVVAVYENMPQNSSYDFSAVGSFNSLPFAKNPGWNNASFETLVGVEDKVSSTSVTKQLQQILHKNLKKEDQWYSLSLQHLEKIHLYSAGYSDSYAARIGDIREITNLTLLALVILIIACINYMNLTTAQSQRRAKEIGINKTLGAARRAIIFQFYAETALITFLSMAIGVCLALLGVPIFNELTGQTLEQESFLNVNTYWAFIALWLILTMIAGSYPAFFLSSFSPKSILSPSQKQNGSAIILRKSLVVLQFAASAVLIVCVTVIYQQLGFIQKKNLGFKSENVVAISTASIHKQHQFKALKNQFRNLSGVSNVALAQGFPGMGVSLNSLYRSESDEKGLDIYTNMADNEILDVLGIQLLAGNSLPLNKQKNDTTVQVVLNKKALAYLGYTPEEAINQKVVIHKQSTIVGVMDDFNFSSLREPIGAYAFTNQQTEPKSYLLVRLTNFSPNTLKLMETTFKKVVPEAVFDYTFLDKNVVKLYEQEHRIAQTVIFFCGLAILIACLGLFGLAAFITERRRKEIGIRKVLGATMVSVVRLISEDFVKLILIALLIAFPAGFWIINRWLQTYAYRINLNWSVFALTALLVVLIALLTVGFQAVKAAVVNPVKSIGNE